MMTSMAVGRILFFLPDLTDASAGVCHAALVQDIRRLVGYQRRAPRSLDFPGVYRLFHRNFPFIVASWRRVATISGRANKRKGI